MNLDGECKNHHYADCVEHNPHLKHTKPEQQSSWEGKFRDIWFESFDHDGGENINAYGDLVDLVKSLLAQAKAESYKEGYYEGEKNEFHNHNFNVSKTIRHLIEEAKEEERQRIAEVVRGMVKSPMLHDIETREVAFAWGTALGDVLQAIEKKEVE